MCGFPALLEILPWNQSLKTNWKLELIFTGSYFLFTSVENETSCEWEEQQAWLSLKFALLVYTVGLCKRNFQVPRVQFKTDRLIKAFLLITHSCDKTKRKLIKVHRKEKSPNDDALLSRSNYHFPNDLHLICIDYFRLRGNF